MALTADIVQSWSAPRVVMRRLLARGASEPFAISFLLIFLAMALVATAPNLARMAQLSDAGPMAPRLFAAALGLMATIPLWYLAASISHLLARSLGGRGSFYGARLALFWALVAISPAMLVQGLVAGLIGAGLAVNLLGLVVATGFAVLWFSCLREAEMS